MQTSETCLQAWPVGVAQVAPGWQPLVRSFLQSESGVRLAERLQQALSRGERIYPANPLRVLQMLEPKDVRAVIMGQDPYHGPGQANGLAFAVAPGLPLPPSLRNMLEELERDYGQPVPCPDGLLDYWATQGVLLLNSSLTVADGQPGSHARWGWQDLTMAVFRRLARDVRPRAFLLWGRHAQTIRAVVVTGERGPEHLWLMANHPSPLSARRPPQPFIGCGHFRQVNDFLQRTGQPTVDWLGLAR